MAAEDAGTHATPPAAPVLVDMNAWMEKNGNFYIYAGLLEDEGRVTGGDGDDEVGDPVSVQKEQMDTVSRTFTVHTAMDRELTDEAKETILYLAIRANFAGGSVSEVKPRVPRAVMKSKSRHFNTTLRAFLPRLPMKKKVLPGKLESVLKVDRSEIKPSTFYGYKRDTELLFKFMSAKARTVLNAEIGEGNICIAGCPRSDSDDRVTCAGCTVSYHTKCLAIDGLELEQLISTYFCPKCEDEAQRTEFRRAL